MRKEVALFQALADVRAERNDLNDAKMRAWYENRPKVDSNKAFDDLWLKANSSGNGAEFDKRERDLKAEIAKIEKILDHLRYAGLGDLNEYAA